MTHPGYTPYTIPMDRPIDPETTPPGSEAPENSTPDELQEKIKFALSEVDAFRKMYKEERADHLKTREILDDLRRSSNHFRLLMFTLRKRPDDCDGAYFFHLKDHWNHLPVETVMDFLELFEKHFNLASEIVRERKGRDAIKVYNKAKLEAGLEEAKALREAPARKKKEKEVKKALVESDKRKRKALEGIMTTLKCTEEKARIILDATVGKINL